MKAVNISESYLQQIGKLQFPPEINTIQAKVNHLVGIGLLQANTIYKKSSRQGANAQSEKRTA